MARKKKGEPVHGWLILDKPEGVTSTQAVGICRRIFNAQKAGHGGTLDPLASGILPLAFGEATKTVGYVMEADKDYVFTYPLGLLDHHAGSRRRSHRHIRRPPHPRGHRRSPHRLHRRDSADFADLLRHQG